MTAEPSAADVERALPYAPPHFAGGSALGAKPRHATAADDEQENHRDPQHRHRHGDDAATGDGDDNSDDRDGDGDDLDADAKGAPSHLKVKTEDDTVKSAEDDDDDDKKAGATKKSRRELPPHTVAILKGWMLSPEHVKHPYPTDEDKQMLLKKTGINMKQLTNWFTNARKRIWKPMMRREHSRQLQSAIEYEKTQPRDGFLGAPGVPHPQAAFRGEGEFPPPPAVRGSAVRHSFDAGSLGAPRQHLPPPSFDPYARVDGRSASVYAPPPHAPSPVGYGPRVGRSHSEALPGSHNMDDYIDAMRIRKRAHDGGGPADADSNAYGPSDKRYRRSTVLSPRSLKILQDWVTAHAHLEYPFPTDAEKLQLSRDTGLDVQQIELWFKSNRERVGAANYAIQNGAPGLSPSRRSLPGRSIPSRDNPMFPPPVYGERRSIPSSGNPMFPPRPTASPMQRSSVPGNGNPQFPPPPAGRRDVPDGYYPPNLPPAAYGSGQYGYNGNGGDPGRQARSMSVGIGQFMHTRAGPGSANPPPPAPVGAPSAPSALPSLANRSVLPRASGPTMGQPRDGRSHTLDMGLFTDARRRKMNFQDILASTSAGASGPHHAPAPPLANAGSVARPPSAAGIAESNSNAHALNMLSASAEPHRYAQHAAAAYEAKSFERPHIGGTAATETGSCARCGARPGACDCSSSGALEEQTLRRIV